MASGTDRTGVDGFGGGSPVLDPVSWKYRGSGVTLSSAGLYNLDTKRLPHVLGLRARQPEAAVVRVMSMPNNRCIRVLIPDENVGYGGFQDVLLHDMAEADSP